LQRYLGRADLSRQIIAAAVAQGGLVVVSDNRDVLADLFYTGAHAGLEFHAPPLVGRPLHHYAQTYPLAADTQEPIMMITAKPYACDLPLIATVALQTEGGAYARQALRGYVMEAACLAQP
jgi:hypothetical protein